MGNEVRKSEQPQHRLLESSVIALGVLSSNVNVIRPKPIIPILECNQVRMYEYCDEL